MGQTWQCVQAIPRWRKAFSARIRRGDFDGISRIVPKSSRQRGQWIMLSPVDFWWSAHIFMHLRWTLFPHPYLQKVSDCWEAPSSSSWHIGQTSSGPISRWTVFWSLGWAEEWTGLCLLRWPKRISLISLSIRPSCHMTGFSRGTRNFFNNILQYTECWLKGVIVAINCSYQRICKQTSFFFLNIAQEHTCWSPRNTCARADVII